MGEPLAESSARASSGADVRSAVERAADHMPEPPAPPLGEGHGLPDAVVAEIERRDQRQFELFVRVTGGGALVLWIVLTVYVYAHAFHSAPLLGLVASPVLAVVGTVIGTLPIAVLCGAGVLLLYPAHPQARELEEYRLAHPTTGVCDVCVLVRDDHRPRPGVVYCSRCDAWLCDECRGRYDRRAIAALKAARPRSANPDRLDDRA